MKKIFSACLILLSIISYSQSNMPQWDDILPKKDITCFVIKDSLKYVGTKSSGVYILSENNNVIETFSILNGLSDNRITAITIDSLDNLWVGTFGKGIDKYDGINWVNYNTNNTPNLGSNYITSFAVDYNKNVWVSSDEYTSRLSREGISKFDGTNWTKYNETNDLILNNKVDKIIVDKDNNIWTVSAEGYESGRQRGISKFNGTNWTNYLYNMPNLDPFSAMCSDSKGNIWIGGLHNKLFLRFDGNNFQEFTIESDSIVIAFTDLYCDKNDNIWIGTDSRIIKFDGVSLWTTYLLDDDMPQHTYANSISMDNEDRIWIGTELGFYILQDSIKEYEYNDKLGPVSGNNYKAFEFVSENQFWVGDYFSGASFFNGEEWFLYNTNNGLTNNTINVIKKDYQNNIWIGTNNGICIYKDNGWEYINKINGLTDSVIKDITFDLNNNVWVGTNNGASFFNGSNWINYTTSNGLASNKINKIFIDNQNIIWIGTFDSGISKFNGSTWEYINTNNGLPYNTINDITSDSKNNIWIGTSIGLVKFDGNNIIIYNTLNGLDHDNIDDIEIDKNDNVWIGKMYRQYSVFDGNRWRHFNSVNTKITSGSEYYFCKNDVFNNKWFIFRNCIYKYNEEGVYNPLNRIEDLGLKKYNVSGKVFYDRDKDGLLTSNDQLLTTHKILVLPDSTYYTFSKSDMYKCYVDTNSNIDIQIIPEKPYENVGTVFSIPNINKDTILPSFPVIAIDTISYSSNFNNGIHRCGNTVPFYYTFRNTGTITTNVIVSISIDNRTTLENEYPKFDSLTIDSCYIWKFTNISPSQDKQVQLEINIPTGLDTLYYTAKVIYQDTILTSDNLYLPTLCSYDPNDKQVYPNGVGEKKLTLKTEKLNYLIRFQNTGNDYAYDVKIIDTLDSQLDISTFILTASSHKVRAEISKNNIITFYFDNIYLPDSTRNYIESNGFVAYSIYPKTSISDSIIINNTSYIIFDQNPAVITNTVSNTMVSNLPCPPTITDFFKVAFDKFVYNGQIYTSSGLYEQNLYDINGCLNTLKINLIITEIPGDINGNNIIDNNEIIGDINGNNVIDLDEIAGDCNGDLIINNNEIAGDCNGNKGIDGEEITGERNGNFYIDENEIIGDINGNSIIDNNEVIGDINGNNVIDLDEIPNANNSNIGTKKIITKNGCEIYLYPIPILDYIQIKYECIPTSIILFDIEGKIINDIKSPKNSQTQINTSNLQSGTYLLQFIYDGVNYSIKFIKK